MAMGWWKPYFFLDPTGVQLLLPNLVIDGKAETLVVSAFAIALIAFLDRYMAHVSRKDSGISVYLSVLCFTTQKFTSGLLMLIMMSFNTLLFLEVVLFSGTAELWMRLRAQTREGSAHFHSVAMSEIEMDGC